MSKDSLQIKEIDGKTLGFSDFWQTVACELGSSRLKINHKATSIKFFLDAESDHKDFLRSLIHLSYKRCHCYHLNARFDVNIALDILGETCFKLQGIKEDDLLDIELLEEIAWLINQNYGNRIRMPESMLPAKRSAYLEPEEQQSTNRQKARSPIVSISHVKIRKANQQL